MKKILSLVLLCTMLLSLCFISGVSAADAVVYVKDGGTGDGSTADKALGDLAAAYKVLGVDGGTIVICGDYTIKAIFEEPVKHTGLVTVTQKYGDESYLYKVGDDYEGGGENNHLFVKPDNDKVNFLKFDSANNFHYFLSGPTTFTNINIYAPKINIFAGRFNKLTFDKGVRMSWPDTKVNEVYVVGGYNNKNAGATVFTDIPKDGKTNVVIKSGIYQQVIGGNRSCEQTVAETNVTITGRAVVEQLYGGGALNAASVTAKCNVTLDGGFITKAIWAGGMDKIPAKDATVTITANFDVTNSLLYKKDGEFQKGIITAKGVTGTSTLDVSKCSYKAELRDEFVGKIDAAFTKVVK